MGENSTTRNTGFIPGPENPNRVDAVLLRIVHRNSSAIAFVVAVLLSLSSVSMTSARPVASTPSQPGGVNEVAGLIDVGDHRLFASCIGAGTPTVLLENGYAMGWEHWLAVQREIAKVTRVCAFDRAGFGMSEVALVTPLTAADIVEDTRLLARALNEPGPFLLAGFSIGGLVSRLYASSYPDEVAGLVLIESTPPEWLDQTLVGMTTAQRGDALLRLSGRDPNNPNAPDPNAPEVIDFLTSAAQLRCLPPSPLKPTVSIVAAATIIGPGDAAEQSNALWRKLQIKQSSALGASQLFANASTHDVPATQPELIVAAIVQVIGELRTLNAVSSSGDSSPHSPEN